MECRDVRETKGSLRRLNSLERGYKWRNVKSALRVLTNDGDAPKSRVRSTNYFSYYLPIIGGSISQNENTNIIATAIVVDYRYGGGGGGSYSEVSVDPVERSTFVPCLRPPHHYY